MTDAVEETATEATGTEPPGWTIVRLLIGATVLLAVVAGLSAAFHFRDDARPPHDSVFALANIVVSLVLFLGGCVAFAVGFLRAVGRSRTEQIEFSRLFFATGTTAPTKVKRALIGCYVAQLVIAVGTALARPLTDQAFVIMAPMCAQGAIALWCGTYGDFPAKEDDRAPRRLPVDEAEDEPDDEPDDAGAAEGDAPGAEAAPKPAPARRPATGARGGPRPRRRR